MHSIPNSLLNSKNRIIFVSYHSVYQMSKTLFGRFDIRLLQVVCAVLWCLLSAGPIFGFAALKPILIDQGVYQDMCDKNDNAVPCSAQDLKLNTMFTIGAVATNIIALPVGWALDNYGPRVCGMIGAFLLSLGSLSFILSKSIKWFDPYLGGYVTLAMGGPFVFISSFQLANTFPQYSGSILAVITGAFDSSSALFLGYRLYYQNLNPNFSVSKFFSWCLLVPLFIFSCQLFIMPSESYKTLGAVHKLEIEGLDENGNLPEGQDGSSIIPNDDERTSFLTGSAPHIQPVLSHSSRRKSVLENYVEAKLEKKSHGIFGVLHGYSAWSQIKSYWFSLMLLFTIITMLRINYFVATVRSQEEYLLGDPKSAAKINAIFDIALPVGGIISIPFIGLILDHLDTYTILVIVSITSVTIGVLGLIPSFLPNLLGILLLVAFRPFYYTVVSDYCSKIFGFETFGTVYGLLICLSGCFNLAQTSLDSLTHWTFKMNPTPVNGMLLSATLLISTTLLLYVRAQTKLRANMIKDILENPNSQYNTI